MDLATVIAKADAARSFIAIEKRKLRTKKAAFQGIPLRIDRPRGFIQHGKDENGAAWSRTYKTDYGYLDGTEGGDDEELDVYLGPDPSARHAHWIIQTKSDGSFDEYKLMLGFASRAEAKAMWVDHTPEKYFGGVVTTSLGLIKALLGIHPGIHLRRLPEGTSTPAEETDSEVEVDLGKSIEGDLLDWLAARDLHATFPEAAEVVVSATKSATCVPSRHALLAKLDAFDEAMLEAGAGGAPVSVHTLESIFGMRPAPTSPEGPDVEVKIVKALDQQFVLSILLEPDVTDAQGDTYNAEEVELAAHEYLATFRNVGLQHGPLINHAVQVVESYIARADQQVGDLLVKAGTWMIGLKVIDAELWGAIRAGKITGVSIGAVALKSRIKKSAPARVTEADSYGRAHAPHSAGPQSEAQLEASLDPSPRSEPRGSAGEPAALRPDQGSAHAA